MPALALSRPFRLLVALLLATLTLLGSFVAWAGAANAAVQPGVQDVTGSMRPGPGNFVAGFTLSADLPVWSSGPALNLSPMCADNQGTFTVTADPAELTGFDLTGLTFTDQAALSRYGYTVRGTTGGGTVSTTFVNNFGAFTAGNYSSFTGLTSFSVTITDADSSGYICSQGFDAFTIANPVGPADLSALSLSSGTLSPSFAAGTTSYTASVSHATTSLTVTPTVAVGTATVTVNGVAVTSGSASGAIALAVGSNTITTVVTAQSGTTRTYTTTVTRPGSSNADLSALALSSGTLSPAFASGTTSYTASVSNATTSLTITPTVADANATITVNGVAATSGNASGAIALNVGSNTISTIVTAQSSATKTYTTTVTRAASSNNNLSALTLSAGALSPVFNPATTSYTAAVSFATASLAVTPTVAVGTATVTVNGVVVTSGSASGAIALAVGSNTVTTVVTAQNGATKPYTTTVTRAAASPNADLSALMLSSGTLSPVFASGATSYTASVPNGTASITVTPTATDATATITVNGVPTTSGNASGAIALNVGANTLTTVVTAQNGTPKTYTATVTRAPSSLSTLAGLLPSAGTLSPTFASVTTGYTASVGNSVTSLTLTPTLSSTAASITVNGDPVANGTASSALPLAVGTTTLTTVVTAQDGVTTTTYTVAVTRAGAAPVFTDTDLGALQVGVAVTDGVQASGTPAITYAVTAGALPAGLTLEGATGAVTGVPTAAGPFTAEITASNTAGTASTPVTGTVQAATTPVVMVTDPPTAGASAAGETVGFTGAGLVPGSTVVVTLYSTPVQLYSGTVAADGSTAPTVTLPAGIPAGAHRIETVVTAPDGTTTTATVWFTVLADGRTGAVSLAGPVTYDAPVTPTAAPQATGAGELATTGSPVAALAGIAVLLVAAGGLTLTATRRRGAAAR